MDNSAASKLTLSPHLDTSLMLLDCCVEKYKQPGIKNVFGNKNKKWLRLNLTTLTLSYRDDRASNVGEKSFRLDTIQRLILDLSKEGKYYVQVYLQDKVIKFKFLEFQDWIRFTEVFTKISRKDTGEQLLKPSEKYLTMLIDYKEKSAKSLDQPHKKLTEMDLNLMPKKANIDHGKKPPTEHIEEPEASSDSDSPEAQKSQLKKKQLTIKKPQQRTEAEESHTQHEKKLTPIVTKEELPLRKKESSEDEEESDGRNAIIKNRMNIG